LRFGQDLLQEEAGYRTGRSRYLLWLALSHDIAALLSAFRPEINYIVG